ncbi:GRIP and coiled-coil domain-containing protein 2 [Sinocyclocheilus anshuiensis]|uniref:GRIP and coiled-coil domain-containing protein 2 n=2 Tax=Sinocyclocheilus anshuiensis TaxID=1608454 RepID=UPI0007B79B76|nr:PREDICTED: GRIP and coiled-coil domain-containing protein 2 [Sinocyclocheilus anshuiensis]
MEDTNPESLASPAGQSSGKSKLDTLSKEDLIKFAKKQMVAMQKIKSKCTDLEKEIEVLKHAPSGTSDSSVIQELSERMDAVLQEKAESHQSLTLLRREHEEFRKQAQETVARLAALQEELDFKNKECTEMQTHTAELTADFKATCTQYESRISQTQEELEEARRQWMAAAEDLKDSHQTSLTESQQETENLQREIQRLNRQYEDDVRFLEEQLEVNAADFERERERLLLLQEELSEQLALKEGFLQDVQEEEEDTNRAGPPKQSPSAKISDDSSHEASVLKLALEDLQSRNMMLQEELVFLRNVKRELESELKQVREEFTVEKEELEFRIDELQMNRGEERCSVSEESHSDGLKQTCWSAGGEQQDRPSAPSEDQDRAERFMKQYRAMKEHTAASLQALQEKLQSVFQERDRLLEHCINAEEASESAAEGLEMSFEDLRNKNEEILVSLQHEEALVLKFKEMLKFTRSESEHELTQASNLENQLSSVTEEKDERIKTLEEDVSALQARQDECGDTIKLLRSQISSLSEERDGLQRDMEANQEHLSGLQCHITEILQQSFSETEVDGSSDISALIDRLWTAAQEEKAVLRQQLEERVEHVTAELQARIHDLLREKDLLKASLDDVLLDTEGLQKDLREMQAMNEKLRAENHSLLAQVADLSRGLEEKGKESPDESDAQVHEASELQQALADRDAVISQLREEVAHLQMCKESSLSDENEQIKALSHEIEMLKKESKDKDERMNKIKAVAVKAKKELDNSKKEVVSLREEADQLKAERDTLSRSMKDIIHGAEDYKNLMVDYDKQAELLDLEREKLEQASKHSEDLTKRLHNAVQQHELLSSERQDLTARIETLQSNATQLESQILETQKLKCGLERELEAERLLREQKSKEHQSAVREVEELQAQLSRHKHQLQQTAQELEQLRKDAQQSTLMDMEMADYEKLVKELNHKLCEKDKQMEEHEMHIQTQKEREQRLMEEIESLKLLLDQTEDKASRMKQLLVKTKKDLADAKQKEAAQVISQSALRGDLEAHQQQLEVLKIQCSELTAERHRLQEQLKLMSEQHQRTSSSYQHSLNTLQDECTTAKADLVATVSEFESYKVRVHNVLKQQKHKSSAQSDGNAFKQEREHMEAVVEQLRSRLQETQQSLQSSTSELQQLQVEHDTLLERHNRILQESVSKEAELRERLLSLQSESVALKSEHGQCAAQLSAQSEALRSSFREQTRHLQDEHCSTVETLQQQISRLEAQLFQLQKEPSSIGTVHVQHSRKGHVDRRPADVPQLDLQGMAREEGEGMETTETESLSSSGTPLPSLEQLLTSADLKHEPVVWHTEPSKEELTQKLSTAARSMEHLNSLLHETEATNAVLMEQITLLKSEVRRLERNQEREKSVANLEYLKNVLLQFIFLRSGSERQALLPVIHTMLQLSPEEKSKLAAIAQGEEESAGSRGSGWTSYLHSWSGIR